MLCKVVSLEVKKEVREGYKMTELGEIPSEWKILRLDELANIKRGASPRPISDSKWFTNEKNVGWIRISDVTNTKKFLNTTEQYLSEEGIAKSRIVNKGDLIMSICATVGKPIILNMLACIHDGFVLFDNLNNNLINTQYLFYLLQKKEEEFKNMGQIGTQANLNTNIVGRTVISLPRLNEQEKIVEILSTVDKQIENTEKLIQKNQELKKGLMQQLLTKGIGHKEFNKTEFGDIPKEWSVISSNKVFNVITDYVANGSFADLAKNVEYKEYEEYAILVRLTDYKNNYKGPFIYVDKNAYDFLGKSKLEENDIIISNVGAYAGYVFRAPSIKKPITLGPNAILVRSNENRDFLYYWLSSDIGQKKIREIISTTAQPKFNKTDFKKIKLPIPSLDEQEKIALILSSIDKKIEQDKYKKEKLEEVKKGLMQNLLTGKLRVI